MPALKRVGGAIVVVVAIVVLAKYWREIAGGIAMIALVALIIGVAVAMLTPNPSRSNAQGPPAWWWAEQAEERREAERAERHESQASIDAAQFDQAAERAAWEDYRRNQ